MSVIYNCTLGFLGAKLASQLNPALNLPEENFIEAQKQLFNRPDHFRLSIPTPDGENLDGIKIGSLDTQKAIIFCLGSGGCYEELETQPNGILDQYVQALKEAYPSYAIVIVNSRGIVSSTGYPNFDGNLGTDLESTIHYLETTEKMTNIVVWAHSLGGISAVQCKDIQVILDRTPATVSAVINNQFGLSGISASIVNNLVWSIGWGINLKEKIECNPERFTILYASQDSTIPKSISLGYALKTNPNVSCIKISERDPSPFSMHTTRLTRKELKQIQLP